MRGEKSGLPLKVLSLCRVGDVIGMLWALAAELLLLLFSSLSTCMMEQLYVNLAHVSSSGKPSRSLEVTETS